MSGSAFDVTGPAAAPALVLLHAVGTSMAVWDAQVDALSAHFRVVRIDARGHGRSPATDLTGRLSIADLGRDVLAVLDELGLRYAHLAGLSLGAMTAMWLAIHHPERVRRLALLCTSAHPGNPDSWRTRATTVRTEGMDAVADPIVARWVTPAFAQREPGLVQLLRAQLTSTDPESYAQCCEVLADLDLRAELPRVAAATLVISAGGDEALPAAHSDVITSLIPRARAVGIEPAAHLAVVEAPERITELLGEHFGPVVSPAGGYRTRRSVLGEAHVDRTLAAATPFTVDFQDFITRYAWGEVWSRPGLGRRERSIATLAALVAVGAEHELALHVRAAVTNGLTSAEIGEVLLHTAVYAGVPRANRAFAIAQQTLAELEPSEEI